MSAVPNAAVRFALYLYAFSLPIEIPERTIPLEVHSATAALLLLVALFQPRVTFKAPPAAFWFYSAYVVVFVSLGTVTDHLGDWLRDSVLFVQLLLVFWVTANLMRYVEVARVALWSVAAACCLLAVTQFLGLTATVAEVGDVAARVTALGQNPNTFAHNLSIGLLAIVGLTFGSNAYPKLRLPGLALCGLLGLTIMPTGARGALLALMMGVAFIVTGPGSMQTRARNAVVAALVLVGLAAAAYRADGMRNRLLVAADSSDLALREQLFPAAWEMFLEKPILGWGPWNNRYELQTHVPRIELPYRETHNVALEVLTETGLVGGAPFLIAMIMSLYAAWVARKGPHGAMPVAMTLLVVSSRMATAGVGTKMHWFVLAFAIAAARPIATHGAFDRLAAARSSRVRLSRRNDDGGIAPAGTMEPVRP